MQALGFNYYGCCGLGTLDKSPAFNPGEYEFKALKDVSNIGEAWEYVYHRWEEASKVEAAKQAVEIYEEVFNGLTEEFKKSVQALDWTQSEKDAKNKSLNYISQWSTWKSKLNTAWNILEQARGGKTSTQEPSKKGKKEPATATTATTAPATTTATTDLRPPTDGKKPFPWFVIGAGAVGIGLVILLLGMRKRTIVANVRNLYAKTRQPDDPYEIWETLDGSWRWYVLKKYQADDFKPYARWFVKAFSPHASQGELGDTYASEIMNVAHKVGGRPPSIENPRYSPGVGMYIREEMHKIGKSPHVQSRAQAIAVGISRSRKAGLKVPPLSRRNYSVL